MKGAHSYYDGVAAAVIYTKNHGLEVASPLYDGMTSRAFTVATSPWAEMALMGDPLCCHYLRPTLIAKVPSWCQANLCLHIKQLPVACYTVGELHCADATAIIMLRMRIKHVSIL